jgi:hypothetical protein
MLINFPNWIVLSALYIFYFTVIILMLTATVIMLDLLYCRLSSMKYFIATTYYVIAKKVGVDKVAKRYTFELNKKYYVCEFKEDEK